MRRAPFALVLTLLLACSSWAQTAPDEAKKGVPEQPQANPSVPVQPMGSEPTIDSDVFIGSPAPQFKLDGSQGQVVGLDQLKGKWAVMVFSDDRAKLKPLGAIDGDLEKLGAHLYGITPDGAAALQTYAEREHLPFLLLSDLTGEISQLFGMYDLDNDAILPGIVLLDPKGVVRMTLLGQALHGDEVLQLVKHVVAGA